MNEPLHLYLVLAMRTDRFDPSVGDAHQAFLKDLVEQDLLELTGPFTDATGGAYLLRAPDLATARGIAHADPLHTTGSSTVTVHEWRVTRFDRKG